MNKACTRQPASRIAEHALSKTHLNEQVNNLYLINGGTGHVNHVLRHEAACLQTIGAGLITGPKNNSLVNRMKRVG